MSIAFSLFLAFTELPHIDKLVFESAHQIYAVIASQCAHWRGNPPVEWNQVTITTKNRKVFPLCRAIVDTFSL